MKNPDINIDEHTIETRNKTVSNKYNFKSILFKNGFLLIGSNAIGQALSFIIYPVLTRLYTTEDFGIFATFLSVTGLLAILSTGKYEDAFFLTKDEKETSLLLGFTLKLLFAFTITLTLILLFIKNETQILSQYSRLHEHWFFVPLTVLFIGFSQILVNIANKEANYRPIAASNISLNGFSSVSKIILAGISKGSGLISGNLVGQMIACLSFTYLKKRIVIAFKNNWNHERAIGKKHKSFPIFNMPKSFINSFSGNLPFLILGVLGDTQLGLYSLAFTSAFRPINLVSGSFYKIYFQKAAAAKINNTNISSFINDFFKKSILYILPFFILAIVIAEPLFKFIFGTSWEKSGTYFQLILPWMFMVFITTPLGFIPIIFEKQKKALTFEIIYFIGRAISLVIGIYINSFEVAIFLFAITGFFYRALILLWYRFLIKNYENYSRSDQSKA